MNYPGINNEGEDFHVGELELVAVTPMGEGPDYDELLTEHSERLAGTDTVDDRTVFEDGLEVGELALAAEILANAPGSMESQADAARWARWAHHQLTKLLEKPCL